jgi:hypothetical protein
MLGWPVVYREVMQVRAGLAERGVATLPPHVAAMQQRCESSKQQCEKLLQSNYKQNQCFREGSRNVEVKGGQSDEGKELWGLHSNIRAVGANRIWAGSSPP